MKDWFNAVSLNALNATNYDTFIYLFINVRNIIRQIYDRDSFFTNGYLPNISATQNKN